MVIFSTEHVFGFFVQYCLDIFIFRSIFNSLVTIAVHMEVKLMSLDVSEKELVGRYALPVVHSTSGDPVVPGGHLHTNNVPSRMHSAFLPQPTVRQSGAALSGLPE